MTDEAIIEQIRANQHDAPIKQLYKEYDKVRPLMLKSGGDKESARETFHDALVIFIEKVNDPSFDQSSKLSTFLIGITRMLWKNKLRKMQSSKDVEWSDGVEQVAKQIQFDEKEEERIRKLEKVLLQIAKRCQEIFKRFYFNKESMKAIASAMGFASVNSAKTQKYKCIEQAIKIASKNS